MNNCQHLSRIGDNYGESCLSCGKQLSGYGYGGWFGRNLTGKEKCIHLFAPMGERGSRGICVYCEEMEPLKPLKLKPDPHCKYCLGTGEVYDSVPYGSTTASFATLCSCIEEQIPEGREDEEIELDLSDYHRNQADELWEKWQRLKDDDDDEPTGRDDKRADDAFTDWNAGERPADWHDH